jgi:hypothetical protein
VHDHRVGALQHRLDPAPVEPDGQPVSIEVPSSRPRAEPDAPARRNLRLAALISRSSRRDPALADALPRTPGSRSRSWSAAT